MTAAAPQTTMLGEKLYFSLEEYEERLAAAGAEMEARGYDFAVVWQKSGGSYDRAGWLYYLTNYASLASGQEPHLPTRSFAALLLRRGEQPELHIAEPVTSVDPRYIAVEQIVGHHDLALGLAERLREIGASGRIAYMGHDFLPVRMYEALTNGTPDLEWAPEDHMLLEVQSNKSPRELELYREMGGVASQALDVVMKGLMAGKRQCDAAADAAQVVMRAGGGFQRIATATGPFSELSMWENPLYAYSKTRAEEGDLVRAWVYGPVLNGYWIDPGRSAVCGNKPSAAQRKLIEDTVGLVDSVKSAIRPGATPRDAGIAGDQYLSDHGFSFELGAALWDVYGHDLSTFFHSPFIPGGGAATFQDETGFWRVDRPFHAGQIFTVECFMQEPGVGTATFEDVFIVWEDGLERLITTPMIFW